MKKLALLALAACATPPAVSPARFANQAAIWKVNDRKHVARKPETRPFARSRYYFHQYAGRPIDDLLAVRADRRASSVNALDEVPDSTWFENRIGLHDLPPEALKRGPNRDDGPDRSAPWKVKGTKVGGRSAGLTIKDARGIKYILKFDLPHLPESETGTDVILQRLVWAAGYHVPEDHIVYFRRDELVLADDAEVKDIFDQGRPMTEADLNETLKLIKPEPDGRYRGLASQFLAGKPLGGFPQSGTRADDPNDTIPHEDRRELRGIYVLYSWLNNTDTKEDNGLDMLVEDPADPKITYVKHYMIDFGKGLGLFGYANNEPTDGFTHRWDYEYIAKSLFAFGLWKRPWESVTAPGLTGVGRLESKAFDPGEWHGLYPWEPFERLDLRDAFWGAKIVLRFTRAHVEVAVEQGQLTDPRARQWIIDRLMERREKIGRYWLSRINPLDRFHIEGDTLCYDDLWRTYALGEQRTSYSASAYDHAGRPLRLSARPNDDAAARGRVCLPDVPAGPDHDGYVIVALRTYRDGIEVPGQVLVHIARGPQGSPRVIGVWRE